ncbi:MAG: hypothetical protein GY803_16970 [Chloroflexi bacterium]|nr:hypothetical protein [Chloroflexota bacterium]
MMDTVTIQGPVVVLPTDEYQAILSRLNHLERIIGQLTQRLEDLDDIKAIREAEVEYQAGDSIAFSNLLAEIQTETE